MQKQIQLQPHEQQTFDAAQARKTNLLAELGQMALRRESIEKTELAAAGEAERAITMSILTRNNITQFRNVRFENGMLLVEVADEEPKEQRKKVENEVPLKTNGAPQLTQTK